MPSRISQMRNEPQQMMQQPQQFQINEEYLHQLKTLMNSSNAMQYLTEIAEINPQFKTFLEMARTKNLQPVFEMMARQRNVDPNLLLNYLLN